MLPAELNAAAVLISYWSSANSAGWIALCLVVAVAINLGGTRAYGEMEVTLGLALRSGTSG